MRNIARNLDAIALIACIAFLALGLVLSMAGALIARESVIHGYFAVANMARCAVMPAGYISMMASLVSWLVSFTAGATR